MVVSAVLVAYLTVSSALPRWMPLGGSVVNAGAYTAVARPVGTLFSLLMAVCPMLGWRKTDGAAFAHACASSALLGAALFAGLMALFVFSSSPVRRHRGGGGTRCRGPRQQGPKAYYFAMGILGFATGALLFASSAYLLGRGMRARMRNKGEVRPRARSSTCSVARLRRPAAT